MRTRASILLCALALAGCVPTDFDSLRGEASTIALAPPADYANRGFGGVIAVYAGERDDGTFGSRVAVSAGASTPWSAFPVVTGDELRLDTPVIDGCSEDYPCDPGAAISLAGMPRWGERELCTAAASPETGQISIYCEDDVTRIDLRMGPAGQRFGATAIGLPDHPYARALFGAPTSFGGRGSVYRLPDGMQPVEIDLSEGAGGAALGSALAVAVVDADTVLFAAASPSPTLKRVVVAQGDVGGSLITRVHECIDGTTPGFGSVLAIGDLSGDGRPEVIVGSALEEGRSEAVRVYDGAMLPPAGNCTNGWPVAIELTCPEVDGIDCAAGSFGAALAVGDVDADGRGDLLVGMPNAEVEGVGGAGAVFVFAGAATLPELDQRVAALTTSTPASGAGLGSTVAASPGAISNDAGLRRDEPIAGAPGADRVYVFLCSGLDGDSPETTDSPRCQP